MRAQLLNAIRRPTLFTSEWRNATFLNYEVPRRYEPVLRSLVPNGWELDRLPNGSAAVSVVAVDLSRTTFAGVVPIPNSAGGAFPAVNLRINVRRGDKHGVVFIRELGTSKTAAWFCKNLLGEPFVRADVRSARSVSAAGMTFHRQFPVGGRENRIEATVHGTPKPAAPGTLEHFFTQREFGAGKSRLGALHYDVEHPAWNVYSNADIRADIDFSRYGHEWAFLNRLTPFSVFHADGSKANIKLPSVTRRG